jgi:hypothetical protein
MPAFLTPDLWDDWLSPVSLTVDGDATQSKAHRAELLADLDHTSSAIASTMRTYEVDRRVNNSRTVDPSDSSLIEPVS